MRQLIHIVLFWIAVVVIVRAAVCFPESLLARVLFWRVDPAPLRAETKPAYDLRLARFAASWFLQAAFLFLAGWIAIRWDSSLADFPLFLLYWAVVIPGVGGAALTVVLLAVIRATWSRWSSRGHVDSRFSHGVHG